jgi:hypothetical protein
VNAVLLHQVRGLAQGREREISKSSKTRKSSSEYSTISLLAIHLREIMSELNAIKMGQKRLRKTPTHDDVARPPRSTDTSRTPQEGMKEVSILKG